MTLLSNLQQGTDFALPELRTGEDRATAVAAREPLSQILDRVEEILGYSIQDAMLASRYGTLRARASAARMVTNALTELEAESGIGIDGAILDAQARAWRDINDNG